MFDYAKTIGNIAIRWNLLEVGYHEVFSPYLQLDKSTEAAILNLLGSNQKFKLLEFLARNREDNPHAREHLLHLGKMVNIVEENRNVVEHGLPKNAIYTPNKTLLLQIKRCSSAPTMERSSSEPRPGK